MYNIPLNSIESFTHVNDKNTKGQGIKVIGYKCYHKHFYYVVLINNEEVLRRHCTYKHKLNINPFDLIREVLYPDTHQKVLDTINTLKKDLFNHEVSLKWDEQNFCGVETYLSLRGEMKDYYWKLLRKAEDTIELESDLDWFFESRGYSELSPNWNIPFD